MMPETKYTNRLIRETSPYLLQHAHNPVDWYPWGEEAFTEAKRRDIPLLVSIGYSACHWCHVMERESFENEAIAELMNRYFINIKVDREERPDLDQIYQQAVQLLTGQGGWPLTVFLDTSGRPFFGGTYFPPEPRYGRMSFPELLESIHDKWLKERGRIAAASGQLLEHLQSIVRTRDQQSGIGDPEAPLQAISELAGIMDRCDGGFGRTPKFPNFNLLQLFLRVGNQHGKDSYINLAEFTLKRMAQGGIHDHLGGGFHRYSTDPHWLVPHFEKMLYDNALLIRTYTIAYQIKPDEEFKLVVRSATGFVRREMTAPEGGFYATLDADSEGEEGRYYLWRLEEIRDLLPDDLAQVFIDYYSVTKAGNFDGKNILNRIAADSETGLNPETLKKLNQGKTILLAAREKRVKPFRDEKIITGWNGLMIGALAFSYQIFQNPLDYKSAKMAAEFLLKNLRMEDGSLAGIYKDGQAKIRAYLDDYAFLAQGLMDLYEADFNRNWLENALSLTKTASGKFGSPGGRYYLTEENENLITRPLSGNDQAVPAGVAVHCENLLRLAAFTGAGELREEARKILAAYQPEMAGNVWGYATLISVLDIFHENYKTFSFISDQPATPEILAKARKSRLPYHIIAWHNTALGGVETHPARELFKNRNTLNGKPTCYLCYGQHCLPPVTEWEDLSAILSQLVGS
ncbi:MAG: thioredoxin domain-containing protein [Firmicutes bacterium]|nr:thioredoxin domain-containing protein [Bacillota bacterium]